MNVCNSTIIHLRYFCLDQHGDRQTTIDHKPLTKTCWCSSCSHASNIQHKLPYFHVKTLAETEKHPWKETSCLCSWCYSNKTELVYFQYCVFHPEHKELLPETCNNSHQSETLTTGIKNVENVIGICLVTYLYSDVVRRIIDCDRNMLWTRTYSWPYYSLRQKDSQLECPIKTETAQINVSQCLAMSTTDSAQMKGPRTLERRDWSDRPERRGSNKTNVNWEFTVSEFQLTQKSRLSRLDPDGQN